MKWSIWIIPAYKLITLILKVYRPHQPKWSEQNLTHPTVEKSWKAYSTLWGGRARVQRTSGQRWPEVRSSPYWERARDRSARSRPATEWSPSSRHSVARPRGRASRREPTSPRGVSEIRLRPAPFRRRNPSAENLPRQRSSFAEKDSLMLIYLWQLTPSNRHCVHK